jgi:hypothetical protein
MSLVRSVCCLFLGRCVGEEPKPTKEEPTRAEPSVSGADLGQKGSRLGKGQRRTAETHGRQRRGGSHCNEEAKDHAKHLAPREIGYLCRSPSRTLTDREGKPQTQVRPRGQHCAAMTSSNSASTAACPLMSLTWISVALL